MSTYSSSAEVAAAIRTQALERLGLDLGALPPLLDDRGVCKHVLPIGRSTLYAAASAGEIQTASIGAPGRRGRRLYVTLAVVAWVLRRMDQTLRPAIGSSSSTGNMPLDTKAPSPG